MTPPPPGEPLDDGLPTEEIFGVGYRDRLKTQIGIIQEAIGNVGIGFDESLKDASLDNADPLYLYKEGVILVRDEDIPRVFQHVGGDAEDSLINGVTLWKPGPDWRDTLTALRKLDEELGVGAASFNHIVYTTDGVAGCCGATEPEEPPVRRPYPPVEVATPSNGTGVLVSVVDTGFLPAAATHPDTPWLAGVYGDVETVPNGVISQYLGHGTFVAGVVRTIAPKALVRVEGFFGQAGAICESNMIIQLDDALRHAPDIISISAGTRTRNNLDPLTFEMFWKNRLRHYKGTVLVAAAGNDGNRGPFWPAAFPWAVSVGALRKTGDRAKFTNFGSWVDVYALGVDVVNAYATGTYTCVEAPNVGEVRHFDGLARWSGTSFSTPIVSGLIAARMSQTGESARRAADELLRIAQINAKPGVGARIGPGFQL
jgi:subtilisin family serine protease